MKDLRVVDEHTLAFAGKTYACAVGSRGFTSQPAEGDKATPRGIFPLRECWYRADRVSLPQTLLPLRAITPTDGWCDAPDHPDYNRPITLPFAASHEELWRGDNIYDIIVPLGFNDAPVTPGLGSAIFLHLARPGYTPTLGCVAVSMETMLEILPQVDRRTVIRIADL